MRDLGRRGGPPKDRLCPGSRVPDPVSYTAVLPIGEPTVVYVSGLLNTERRRRRTRRGRRALGSWRHAVLVLRWFLDARRPARRGQPDQQFHGLPVPARGGIDVLAAAAPDLHGALLAARSAGHSHVSLDGTLHRPLQGRRPDCEGRPVVVRQASPSRAGTSRS